MIKEILLKFDKWCEDRPHEDYNLTSEQFVDKFLNLHAECNIDIIDILNECKDALINRDAVDCYDSGHIECKCTLCRINNLLSSDSEKSA